MTGTLRGLARKAAAEPSSASTEISPAVELAQPCLRMSVGGAAGQDGARGKEVLLLGPPSYQRPHGTRRIEADKAEDHAGTWCSANLYLVTGLRGFPRVSQHTATQRGAGKKVARVLHPTFLSTFLS